MVIDRRAFIQGGALLATGSALTVLLPVSSPAQSSLLTGAQGDEDLVVFKIDGWDCCNAEVPTENEAWIRINRSWRAVWR